MVPQKHPFQEGEEEEESRKETSPHIHSSSTGNFPLTKCNVRLPATTSSSSSSAAILLKLLYLYPDPRMLYFNATNKQPESHKTVQHTTLAVNQPANNSAEEKNYSPDP